MCICPKLLLVLRRVAELSFAVSAMTHKKHNPADNFVEQLQSCICCCQCWLFSLRSLQTLQPFVQDALSALVRQICHRRSLQRKMLSLTLPSWASPPRFRCTGSCLRSPNACCVLTTKKSARTEQKERCCNNLAGAAGRLRSVVAVACLQLTLLLVIHKTHPWQ